MKDKSIFICKTILYGLLLWIDIGFFYDIAKHGGIFILIAIILSISLAITIYKEIIKFTNKDKVHALAFGRFTIVVGIITAIATVLLLYFLFGSFFK